MFQRLFDSPAQLLILVLIIVLLFGATRLPNVARQLGRSMRIFKTEMKEMRRDGEAPGDGTEDGGDGGDTRASGPAPLEGRVVGDGADRAQGRGPDTQATASSPTVPESQPQAEAPAPAPRRDA